MFFIIRTYLAHISLVVSFLATSVSARNLCVNMAFLHPEIVKKSLFTIPQATPSQSLLQ